MITPAYAPTATERVLPRLALDFTTGVLDPRVTVTRALDTATRVNSSGLIASVNANLPRFDYDPVTLAPKGLLIEEARTNLRSYSQDLSNPVYLKTDCTISTDAATAPDGTTTADKIVENTANTAHFVYSPVTITGGAVTTFSSFLKTSGRNAQVRIQSDNGTFSYVLVNIDLSNGTQIGTTTSSGASSISLSVKSYGSGWYRVELTAALAADVTSAAGYIFTYNNGVGYAGDGTSGVFAWGWQHEAGAFATSYIPTTTTSLTRNTDQVSVTGTNFSSWYNGNQGTFKVRGSRFAQGTFAPFMSVNGGSNTNEMYMTQVGNSAQAYSSLGGDLLPTGTWATNTTRNFTFAYKANTLSGSFNGGTVANTTPATIPTVDRMFIGRRGNGLNLLSGYVEQIFYWPQYLTNAETQAFAK